MKTLASIAAAALLFALPSAAEAAKAKAKAKVPGAVTVTNARTESLTSLVIQSTGDSPRVVATVAKPLAGGKSVKLSLKKPQGCAYNVLAQFADGSESEAEDLDLCKDGKIRLTE